MNMDFLSVLEQCMALDEKALEGGNDSETAKELVNIHLALSSQMKQTDEAEISALSVPDEVKKQILSEKQLIQVLGAKGDYKMVTLLTTFSCFLLSRKRGDKMHSGKYMSDVRKLHEAVNLYYGKDPKTAGSCS